MVASMTAFARHETKRWIWEIRSVNHRFLDVSIHLPTALQVLEPTLLSQTRERLNRGRVEATLRASDAEALMPSEVNEFEVKKLLTNLKTIHKKATEVELGHLSVKDEIDPLEVLRWPGVLIQQPTIESKIEQEVLTDFDAALTQLIEAREVEGRSLHSIFAKRIQSIYEVLSDIDDFAAEQLEYAQTKITQRVQKLAVEADPGRVATEIALLAQRADVSEELDRLRTHISEFETCLNQSDPHGRRLGFLVQEMGRESNTLAAKLLPPESINLSVNLKVLIDQIREQVQNVE